MKQTTFEGKVHEAWTYVMDIALFNYSLMFMTAFLAFVLLFALLGIGMYLSVLPAVLVVFAAYMLNRRKQHPLQILEKGNPALRDRLSAAYDNKDQDNFVVKELIRDTNYYLEDLRTDSFFNLRKTGTYVGISIVIVFILLSLMFFGLGIGLPGLFGGVGNSNGGSQGSGSGGSNGGGSANGAGDTSTSQEATLGQGSSQNIYGDVSIAKIEGKNMELEMHPEYGEEGSAGSGTNEKPPGTGIEDNSVQATAAESYAENIPVELEGAIRRYFEKLAGE